MKQHFSYIVFTAMLTCFIYSCANRGMGPQGGVKDETPPKLMKSKPGKNATNYTGKTVEIEFDELIQVQDIFKNIVVSPPQKKNPVVKATGKKISVQFTDTLLQNTTYTIDFGNSIIDNNEKNVLENFSFAFSTGNEIDTLTITGMLIDAQTLDPVAESYVGIHSNLSDTAFSTLPFLRMTKSNEKGEFFIKNVKEGEYHIFGLADQNTNYYFDQAVESIAFTDSIITPAQVIIIPKLDTSLVDTTIIDTSYVQKNDDRLILYQFKEDVRNQYFLKAERKIKENFSLAFNAPLVSLPTIEPINFKLDNNYIIQKSANRDTLTYWLDDDTIMSMDTLNFVLHYEKTDSTGNLALTQDTVNLSLRKETRNQKQRNKKDDDEVIIEYFTFTTNVNRPVMEYYDNPSLKFDTPVREADLSKIHLTMQVDTMWNDVPYSFTRKDSIGLLYEVQADFDAGARYRLELDSAAITSIYDKVVEKRLFNFKVRTFEEYSSLILNLSPFNEKIIVQLLNEKDQVVRQERAMDDGTIFDFVNPGTYYVRLFIDENMNEKWDPGLYKENRQPEKVYYFNKKISLRANWDVEEDWNYMSIPVLKQKPEELKFKNKPKTR